MTLQPHARAAIQAEAQRLQASLLAAGALPVETDVLQPAETLLDLYGEDIRARAYVTNDPLQGEMMLRPDFTVPVVQMHMASGAEPARYRYLGAVFRKQDRMGTRASEFLQVGYEVFDRTDPTAADAEVFALFAQILAPLGLRAATGDMGLVMAAVAGLETSDQRKSALLRHVWRPRRFRALLYRFSGKAAAQPARDAVLARLTAAPAADLIAQAGSFVGLRSASEIAARVETLLADAALPQLPSEQVALLGQVLQLADKSPAALAQLQVMALPFPAIKPAVARLEARLNALASRGVDVDSLDFKATYGRTTLEYYDGFVFGFYAEARPDLPPVASGGRYDALTRVLGQGRSIPAVGGVIRPAVSLALATAAGAPS